MPAAGWRARVAPWLAVVVGAAAGVRRWWTTSLVPGVVAFAARVRERGGPWLRQAGRSACEGLGRAERAAVPRLRDAGSAVGGGLARAESAAVPWLRRATWAAAVTIARAEAVAVRALRTLGQLILFSVDRAEAAAGAGILALATSGSATARRRAAAQRERRAQRRGAAREPVAVGAATTAATPAATAASAAPPAADPGAPPAPAPAAPAAPVAPAPPPDDEGWLPSERGRSSPLGGVRQRSGGLRYGALAALAAVGLATRPAAAPPLPPAPAVPRPAFPRRVAPGSVPPPPQRRRGEVVEVRRGRSALLAGTGALATLGITVLVVNLITPSIMRPVLAASGGAVDVQFEIPDEAALPTLGQRSVIYAADGSVLAVLHDEVDRRIVSLDEVPEHVRQAVITAEDRKFYEHRGYDVEGIGRAAIANLQSRSISQGASTITQQLAKTIVGDEDSLERKISELAYAIALEDEFTKDELLERYLNQTYFGGGAYGIAAAAEEFFGVSQEQLTIAQAATLAGMIRAPGSGDPRRNPEVAKQRRDGIIRQMFADGYISKQQMDEALAEPLEVRPPTEREQRHPYVVAAIIDEFVRNPVFGETRQERFEALYSGGLRIYTTVDPRLQEIADRVVRETLGDDGSGPTAAIAAVDPRNGRVVAIHGGSDFEKARFNLATQGRRQPGSAFKPFVVATALEQGYPVSTILDGSGPQTFNVGGGEPYVVRNFGNASYGPVDLRQTLIRSINTATVQLGLMVGPDNVAAMAERLGINIEAAMGGIHNPAMALGGLTYGVTPLEMASAYGVIANQGNRAEPHLIEKVDTAAGGNVFTFQPNPQRVLSPNVDGAMVSILRDVVRFGTGTRAQVPGWEVAGKTGTTQNSADAWFVGFTPVMSTAVWMGHPEGQIPMGTATGGRLPALMWNRFMTEALATQEPVAFADLPEGPDQAPQVTVEVPDVVGNDEGQALAVLGQARLVGQVTQVASASPAGRVLWQSPRPGTSVTAGQTVTIGVSTGVAPATAPAQAPEAEEEVVEPAVEAEADADGDLDLDLDEVALPPDPRG